METHINHTNTEDQETPKLQDRAGQAVRVGRQQKWALWIQAECYGFVHAVTAQEALDKVSAFKMPFRAELAEVQD